MTKKKPKTELRIVKRTYLGEVDLNEYFKVLILEKISNDS